MGYYTEYLDRGLDAQQMAEERKQQLKSISNLRGGRDVLVYAADMDKANTPPAWLSIAYSDLVPFQDQLSNLKGTKVDLILETGGGSGEVAEDIVRSLHEKYEEVGIIVPGWAKSAGTIIAMAGDEILMDPSSALGPIDAQMSWQGKVFSADALIEGMEKIKREVELTGTLSRAYIPMLQGISPGELQSAENALNFAQKLVADWLVRYKFKNWTTHSSTEKPVTPVEREDRAREIAKTLCDHKQWLTHSRSIKIDDLERMRLRVTDYSKTPDLAEAIRRYHTLLQMTFDSTNIYKLFETQHSQIVRFVSPGVPPPQAVDAVMVDVSCPKCGATSKIQANLKRCPLQPGHLRFPEDNTFRCPNCGAEINLTDAKHQIEVQSKRTVVNDYA
ncbi:MAG: Clp protease ClpP [Candidatus Hydrogenedentes bacterium]|nr:Clp protease ClpP [Candidatus Hydrogenedentota bacterium]